MKVEVGRKDRLPHLLATIAVDIKIRRVSFTGKRCRASLADCLTVCLPSWTTINPKGTKDRKVLWSLKTTWVYKLLFLVDLTVDNKSKPHFFLIFAKETQHQLQTDICKHNKKKKKGSRFGLTKVLLAEGDAPFPFVRHRNTSLRRTLLLRKIMMLAQKDRENSKQQKTKTGN